MIRFYLYLFLNMQDGHKEHPVEMAASPRRQGANAAASEAVPGSSAGPAPGNPSSHYQTTVGGSAGGGMHPLSSVAAGTLGTDHRLAPHSSPAAGLRSMVVQSDFRKVWKNKGSAFPPAFPAEADF